MSNQRPVDPRSIITPEAFAIAPDLIGLPLARPFRRLVAILLDLIPVAFMAAAGLNLFIAGLAAVGTWRVTAAVVRARKLGFVVRVVASLVVFGSIAQSGNWSDNPEQAEAIMAAQMADFMPSGIQATGASADEQPRGILGFLRGLADDLGIGFGWGALYFTAFLVIGNGQTPGKRAMGIRVIRLDGKPIGWWYAFERYGSYFASFTTGLLGFAQVFWDRNRQALHDKVVETVVIRVHKAPPVHVRTH